MIRALIDDPYLGRRNSIHRSRLRQIEKNRFPKKCKCVVCREFFLCANIEDYLKRQYYLGPKNGRIRHVCWECCIENKIKIAAGTLYHLVRAIPQAERDFAEIYPADFRYPRIPLWRQDKKRFPGLGLRDYSEPARLLSKYGRYEPAARQKAASTVRNVLTITIGQLTLPETQTLKRIGRLYKNSCWWSKKDPRCLFDKATALSWKKAQVWKAGQRLFEWDPKDELTLERREVWQIAGGVFVGYPDYWHKPFWLRSHKRHDNLASTQSAYNEKHGSYWNSSRDNLGCANLTKTFRALSSLNIPRETIEVRNEMIRNLERDFGRCNEAKAA